MLLKRHLHNFLLVIKYYDKSIEGCYNVAPDDGVTTQTLVEKFCEQWGEGSVNGKYDGRIRI